MKTSVSKKIRLWSEEKYVIPPAIVGCSLLLISYTDIAIVVQGNSVTNYAMPLFWLGLSVLSFGASAIFTEKKVALMLAIATPVIISLLIGVIMFIIKIPLFPHIYFA